ncbi:response regulator [candidate division KSB1 bacterium]|nr:response regulator [candidate division KSB1 bacterium]NIR72029.1 response regulator [candidate division KSB1 bacterium]NIS25970.1 response regulator [candidate division KSB1 bacterium]NIT74941.1 response regulator [candidate division KSB1 bacterium]NIU28725.1 response regulator [candidate division KSB1 bacterium]
MVALLVIFMIIAFITADVIVRMVAEKIKENKLKKERAVALDVGLKLDYTDEANTLKRVAVENPKARILAVDDEAVVLDSFRKILVLAGYSVDTVETGKEAIGLIQKHNYDFVFTDLKMPEMDGLDVTKAVKHLRPDIDVIMITGYATIESAVDAMKFGALDYVQKPFTEDELVEFVNKSLIRRQDKMERELRPKVHLVTPTSAEEKSEHVFNVPAGLFISPEHAWLSIEMTGAVRIGLDDFAQKIIGQIDEIGLPKKGKKVKRGEPLFTVKQSSRTLTFPSPVSGEITAVNRELSEHIDALKIKPYEVGWICCIEASNLTNELRNLRIGADAVSWYHEEIDKFRKMVKNMSGEKKDGSGGNGKFEQGQLERMDDKVWEAFSKSFLQT